MMPELETIQDAESCGFDFEEAEGWAIRQGWFGGGLADGVEIIELCNGPLSVWVLPTRGMGIWRAEYNGIPVGWNSPVQRPVNPAYVNLKSRNGLGWLDGFNELLCRCGLSFIGPPGHDDGAASPIESEVTLHGKIANIPAHSVASTVVGEGEIAVEGVMEEATLFGPNLQLFSRISLTPGGNAFRVRDEITNLGSKPTELELLYHTNIGWPFLDAGASLVCPARLVVPRDARAAEGIETWAEYLGPTPGYAEQAYLFEVQSNEAGETLTLLKNSSGTLGFSVRYRPDQLPCFTQWKCTQAAQDGYVTGLEPGTNYPNFKAYERKQGRIRLLQPGETYVVELEFAIHEGEDAVQAAMSEIASMQAASQQVLPQATDPYCHIG